MTEFVLPVDEEYDAPLSRPFRQLLANRKISLEELNLEKAYDPMEMRGIEEAVDRIIYAIRKNEKVLIHGDYDADGITSLALLYRVLRDLGLRPIPYIPDRFSEGYGFSPNAIKEAIDKHVKLIITVDCGISSRDEVSLAKSYGIDVIITDHHMKPQNVPETIILHPEGYPNDKLTGVGVAFKLAHAIYTKLGMFDEYKSKLYSLLDLFAVGTIADLGELVGENRLLVKHGLRVLSEGKAKAGFKAIFKSANISPPIRTWHIAFIIAPRLNAAGRMKTAMRSFELLTKTKGKDVVGFAREIEELNRRRQIVQNRIFDFLVSKLNPDEPIIFAYGENLHEGVIGIVASKLLETFNKPSFVISINGDVSKGSARGIEPFNVFESLNRVGHLFENYGGHSLAGGFTIKTSLLDDLKRHLMNYALEVAPEGFVRKIDIDAEVYYEELLDESFWRDKNSLEPYGPGFPEPVFLLKTNKKRILSSDGKNLVILGNRMCEFKVKGYVSGKGDMIITNLRVSRNGNIVGDVIGEK